MKPTTLAIAFVAIAPVFAFAQDVMERPAKEEFFDTVLESVDETTASDLQASRDELGVLRDEVRALRDADEVDEATLQEAVANLRAEHRAFREEIHTVIDDNEDLQLALAEARENFAGEGRGPGRGRHHHRDDAQ